MIVVLDTNILASATYWRGKPAHCLEAWVLGRYDLAVSHPILTEYERVVAELAARYPRKNQPIGSVKHAVAKPQRFLLGCAAEAQSPDNDEQSRNVRSGDR